MSVDVTTTHPVIACAHTLQTALGEVREVQAVYMSVEDKKTALIELTRVEAAVAELKARVLAASGDVADDTGARDPGAWLAHATRTDRRITATQYRLAQALERLPRLAAAMSSGLVNEGQARVIIETVDNLPDRLGTQVKLDAEASLIHFAADHAPADLKRLGVHILAVIAPDIADQEDAARLEAEEQSAHERATYRVRHLGNGRAAATITGPTAMIERLTLYLDALDNPFAPKQEAQQSEQTEQTEQPEQPEQPEQREQREENETGAGTESSGVFGRVDRIPIARRRAWAFQTLLENIPTHGFPTTSGNATQVIVTIGIDELRADLATASILTHTEHDLTATETRRLACNAGILPVVLSGAGQILDAGRTRRLFTGVQRTLIKARHRSCVAEGCDIPVAWTEIHHLKPWADGGHTNLTDGVPACNRHHHLFHEPRYHWRRQPDGRIRFHRHP